MVIELAPAANSFVFRKLCCPLQNNVCFLPNILLRIVVLEFENAPFVSIDNMGILIFVISFVVSPIGHVYMAMKEKFGPVFFQQCPEYLKSLMGQIPPVVQLISGGARAFGFSAASAVPCTDGVPVYNAWNRRGQEYGRPGKQRSGLRCRCILPAGIFRISRHDSHVRTILVR